MDAQPRTGEVTLLLEAIVGPQGGDDARSRDQLFRLVYEQLRHEAHRQRGAWVGAQTLNTTALVHEAYEKMMAAATLTLRDRAHFLAVAARAMRQILLDYAKSQRAGKRGGAQQRVSLHDLHLADREDDRIGGLDRLILLDTALIRLHRFNPEGARIVECRFFAGMTVEETALALDVSEATVKRRWRIARAWLHHEIERTDSDGAPQAAAAE